MTARHMMAYLLHPEYMQTPRGRFHAGHLDIRIFTGLGLGLGQV